MTAAPSVRLEAGELVIILPGAYGAELLAELAECPCAAPKSAATAAIRARLREGLACQPIRWPLRELLGLRVALAPCPCRGPMPGPRSLRHRLSAALVRQG